MAQTELFPPILSFDEIDSGSRFEELAEAYFRLEKSKKIPNITSVQVHPTGTGPDGGADIIVELRFSDGISEFLRRWVVQCKFHKKDISPTVISDNNIPGLIHSYKADGYLLICRQNATSKLMSFFKRLNENCRFKYRYEVWSGSMFVRELLIANPSIRKQFFPHYYMQEQSLEKRKKIKK